MLEQLLAIVRNTFFESIRQPIVLVVLVVATLLLILSNPLATFTMEDDQRMLIDIGLATVFLCGTLLAAFVATAIVLLAVAVSASVLPARRATEVNPIEVLRSE